MTPTEMEEQIKNLNHWTREVAQFLPLLATKEDLKAYATKEDLREAVAKLATKEDLEASKHYSEDLTLVTRREIRQVDDKVTAMSADLRLIAEQVAILTARKRKKNS